MTKAKTLKVSPTKAYRLEPLLIDGERYLSIRQMYRTQKQVEADEDYNFGRQGVVLPLADDVSLKMGKGLVAWSQDEDIEFNELPERGTKAEKDKKGDPKAERKVMQKRVKKAEADAKIKKKVKKEIRGEAHDIADAAVGKTKNRKNR